MYIFTNSSLLLFINKLSLIRHTNLKKLFSHKFRRHSKQSTLSTLDDQNIRSLIDEQCTTSCLVFIDGLYSREHSSTAGIPTGLIAQSIRQVQDADIMGHIKDITNAWVPDLMEPPRNSFGSDLLTALNKVNIYYSCFWFLISLLLSFYIIFILNTVFLLFTRLFYLFILLSRRGPGTWPAS